MIDSEKFIFGKLLNPLVKFFCCLNIHPNIVTLSSFIFSTLLLHYYSSNQFNYFVLMIFLKWLSDGLDGEIARKCNKTSKLGGYLDTIADLYYYIIIFKCILSEYVNDEYAWIISINLVILGVLYLIINYGEQSLYIHDEQKIDSSDKIKKIITFLIKNCLIVHIMIILFYQYKKLKIIKN